MSESTGRILKAARAFEFRILCQISLAHARKNKSSSWLNYTAINFPFWARAISIAKAILINEKTDNYILRAKTGWAGLSDKSALQIGWWVGYVERGGKAYFFAMNVDRKKDEDAASRMTITKNIPREMKIIKP